MVLLGRSAWPSQSPSTSTPTSLVISVQGAVGAGPVVTFVLCEQLRLPESAQDHRRGESEGEVRGCLVDVMGRYQTQEPRSVAPPHPSKSQASGAARPIRPRGRAAPSAVARTSSTSRPGSPRCRRRCRRSSRLRRRPPAGPRTALGFISSSATNGLLRSWGDSSTCRAAGGTQPRAEPARVQRVQSVPGSRRRRRLDASPAGDVAGVVRIEAKLIGSTDELVVDRADDPGVHRAPARDHSAGLRPDCFTAGLGMTS